jgi:hypothetical protein
VTITEIVAALTVTGDFMCRATNVVYRLDTESARSFLTELFRFRKFSHCGGRE